MRTLQRDFAHAVAQDWIAAEHVPFNPSYYSFIKQTAGQMDALIDAGIRIEPWILGQPYRSTRQLFADIERGRLYIFRGGDNFAEGHPLAEQSPYGFSWNEIFRAVHDYFGHWEAQSPFETFEGEIAAYEQHRRLYRGQAIGPLYAETVGQLCYYFDCGGFVAVQKAVDIRVREVPR